MAANHNWYVTGRIFVSLLLFVGSNLTGSWFYQVEAASIGCCRRDGSANISMPSYLICRDLQINGRLDEGEGIEDPSSHCAFTPNRIAFSDPFSHLAVTHASPMDSVRIGSICSAPRSTNT